MNPPPRDPLDDTLRDLTPAPHAVGRDRLMYDAGYAAGLAAARRRPAARLWPAAAIAATAAALLLAASAPDEGPMPKGATVVETVPAPTPELTPVRPMREWDLSAPLTIRPGLARRERTSAPAVIGDPVPPATARTLLEELLAENLPGDDV